MSSLELGKFSVFVVTVFGMVFRLLRKVRGTTFGFGFGEFQLLCERLQLELRDEMSEYQVRRRRSHNSGLTSPLQNVGNDTIHGNDDRHNARI